MTSAGLLSSLEGGPVTLMTTTSVSTGLTSDVFLLLSLFNNNSPFITEGIELSSVFSFFAGGESTSDDASSVATIAEAEDMFSSSTHGLHETTDLFVAVLAFGIEDTVAAAVDFFFLFAEFKPHSIHFSRILSVNSILWEFQK